MYINKMKSLCALVALALATTACSESEVLTSGIDETRYQGVSQSLAFVSDQYGSMGVDTLVLNNEGSLKLYANLNKVQTKDVTAVLEYAPEVLEAYNTKNATSYEALPAELVTLPSEVTIAAGERKSEAMTLGFRSSDALAELATYAIPLKLRSTSAGVASAESLAQFVLLVRDITKMPKANKASGIELISCIEANNTNPLNHLCFTLSRSKKPLFDQVILFAGNINYDVATGRVYNANNANITHILQNREKYLKPLQEKGIKIILGILGNHDRAGIAGLSDQAAKNFAQELKAVLTAYELDGVFFDDEYSKYGNYPGFVSQSYSAASRLCYETKKAIGDKLVQVYVYGYTASLYTVDGKEPGQYIDYAIHDYRQSHTLGAAYPGLDKKRWGLYSQEYAQGSYATSNQLKEIVNGGYKTHMVFAMDPFRDTWSGQKSSMELIATTFYGETLVYDNKPYRKDW